MARYGFAAAGLLGLLPALGHALQGLPVPISQLRKQTGDHFTLQSAGVTDAVAADYPAHTLAVPVDHFHNDSRYEPHSDETFDLRYWFDAQFYKAGGPVIVLSAGETSGVGRLPFLQKGIVYQLAKATGGVGVILEHRYYGESWPVKDSSTENLRFLTTDQALADTAYFAQHVVFPGLEDVDLSANGTAWVAYGGSYAGAFVAFLRVLYPDVFWGAISSSGVTKAIWDYWEYFTAATVFGPEECIATAKKLTHALDNILIGKKGTEWPDRLKAAFGFAPQISDPDLASLTIGGLYDLQSYNWDPEIGQTSFFRYCDTLTNDSVVYDFMEEKREEALALLEAGGYGDEADALVNRTLNWIGETGKFGATLAADCGGPVEECLSTASVQETAEGVEEWKSWPWQYCTQ